MESLKAIAACGAGAAVDPADVPRKMPGIDLAEAIVAAPSMHPLAWVTGAEKRLAQQHVEQPLSVIAEKHGWFDCP